MVAAVALLSGRSPDMADIAVMARETMEDWLRGFDGYRGLMVLTDADAERARIITFWESADAEERSRPGRAAMRDQVARTAGMAVDGMEIYEVPVCDLLEM